MVVLYQEHYRPDLEDFEWGVVLAAWEAARKEFEEEEFRGSAQETPGHEGEGSEE